MPSAKLDPIKRAINTIYFNETLEHSPEWVILVNLRPDGQSGPVKEENWLRSNQVKSNQESRKDFNHLRLATNSFLGTSTSSLVLTDRTFIQVMPLDRVKYGLFLKNATLCLCTWDSVMKMVLIRSLKIHCSHYTLGSFTLTTPLAISDSPSTTAKGIPDGR